MTKREIALILAGAVLLGGCALWGVITVIDHYAFDDDTREVISQPR